MRKINIRVEEQKNFVILDNVNFKSFTSFENKDTAKDFKDFMELLTSKYDLATANVRIDVAPRDEDDEDDTAIPAIIIDHSKGSGVFGFDDSVTFNEIFSAFLFVRDVLNAAKAQAAQIHTKELLKNNGFSENEKKNVGVE